MRLPRRLHHCYAFLAGYFWTNCPRCGRMFGGHEEHGGTDWGGEGTPNVGLVCCPQCPGDRTWKDGEWRDGRWYETFRVDELRPAPVGDGE